MTSPQKPSPTVYREVSGYEIGQIKGIEDQILKEIVEVKALLIAQNSRIRKLEEFRARVYGIATVVAAAVAAGVQWLFRNGGA